MGFYFITNHRPQERAFHLNVQVNRRRLKEEEGRKEGGEGSAFARVHVSVWFCVDVCVCCVCVVDCLCV